MHIYKKKYCKKNNLYNKMAVEPKNRSKIPNIVTMLAENVREENHMATRSTPPKLNL